VIRRIGVLVALAGMAAGCAHTGSRPAGSSRSLALHRGAVAPHRSTRAELVVTIVNGDTNRRVRGAQVRVDGGHDVTNRRGEARIVVPRRAPFVVRVEAHGFTARALRMPFQKRRRQTIRIYRPSLQWTMYGASPQRTQAQANIRVRPPFRVIWSRGAGSLIEFPAVVSDGVAYIGNLRGVVRAIKMSSGKLVWKHGTRHGKMAASPAVWRDELIVHGMDGHVWVLDRATGRLRWHATIGSPIESSPVVWHGIDFFGTWSGRLYALDLRTHRLRWSKQLGAKTTSSAAIAGRTLYIGDYAGRVWALRARTGRIRWVRGVNGRVYGTPAVAGGRVFVPSSNGGSLTAFSTLGRYLWRVHTGSYVYSSPAAWKGRVFFGSYNGVLYAVSARSGRILWTRGTGGAISGAAVVVAGVAYAGSFSHRIVGVDAKSGRVVLNFPHGEYVPVSGNGGHLLLHGFSRLYAVAPR
jgi:outer membrane protein assembly factor BamB